MNTSSLLGQRVAVVGGGLLGLSLGYTLARRGAQVEVFEASGQLGGLAGSVELEPGVMVDRFYHTILSSDRALLALCSELGLDSRLRFHETRTGFFTPDGLYSMNNVADFLRFPPLGWVDRLRLGLTIVAAQLIRDWRPLETVSVEAWLKRWSGDRAFENLWRPMLRAKFDGSFANTPATYIWSRLVRMKSARGGAAQKEMAGYLTGGYATLAAALAEGIRAAAGEVHLNTPVEEILLDGSRLAGLRLNGHQEPFECAAVTLPVPQFRRLIPAAPPEYHALLDQTRYLGVVCPLMVLDRPLTGCWTLNLTDERLPFTGVIETTTYIDPADVGGYHLVYLPKYTEASSEWYRLPDDEVERRWLGTLEQMFPSFDRSAVRHFRVHRAALVEPVHPLNGTGCIPPVRTPVEGLFLATTAQIYPALTNIESAVRHAQSAASLIASA